MIKPRNNAFTIIELIIVVTLVSILFLGILTTYIQIQKLLNSQSSASIKGQQSEELYSILSHDLQNMVFENWNKNFFFAAKKNIIGGERFDILNFISGSAYSNPLVLQSRIYNVSYHGENDPETGSLALYRSEDMFVDYKNHDLGVPIPVLTRVKEFRVEFSLNGRDWEDEWDYSLKKRLPMFIKVTIQYFANDDSGEQSRVLELQTTPGIFY
ncbi:MAG: GspJ family type II secretion system protein [Spirochaetia bacterium]|nr:GspJ family type II secretion system protein [Spirochaetia bacterium]